MLHLGHLDRAVGAKMCRGQGLGGFPQDVPLQGCLSGSARIVSGVVQCFLEQHVVFWGCINVMVEAGVGLGFQGALHQDHHGGMAGDGVDIGQEVSRCSTLGLTGKMAEAGASVQWGWGGRLWHAVLELPCRTAEAGEVWARNALCHDVLRLATLPE